ncbi:MAG: hypothetical protein WAU07_03820, partial [Microgenomates group bacterium]
MKKHLKSLIITVFLLAFSIQLVQAEECEEISCKSDSDEYEKCIERKKNCLEAKISEIRDQKITLSNTISLINGQVAVQELQINQSEAELSTLERQVTELSERISGLNVSLDRLTDMLIGRIQAQYKRASMSPLI